MAQRIAKKTVGGVSVWDVHVEVKSGAVDFTSGSPRHKWLTAMRGTAIPSGLTWEESLRTLLPIFQDHIDQGITVFDGVPMLHYLKFSLLQQGKNPQGQDRYFFCFSTQFDDPSHNEQVYVDDMYQKYGALMEVVWHHCKGVGVAPGETELLKLPPAQLPDPADGPAIPTRPAGFELSEAFLKLVDASNVDRDEHLCFYNSNRDVTSANIKTWALDSAKLGQVGTHVGQARLAMKETNADPAEILGTLIDAFDELEV